MKTGIFPEYLGDISTEALIQNLTNENRHWSSSDSLRLMYPNGFTVSAEIEWSVPENALETEGMERDTENSLQSDSLEPLWANKRLVRLVLEPK